MRSKTSGNNDDKPRNKGQWQKGTSGNPSGRPPGSRNKATLEMEALLEGEAEQLTRKTLELALNGNVLALRLCLERILPARKDRPIELNLPPVQSAKEISEANATVVAAIGAGQITTNQGRDLADILAKQSEFIKAAHAENPQCQKIVVTFVESDGFGRPRTPAAQDETSGATPELTSGATPDLALMDPDLALMEKVRRAFGETAPRVA